jgi:hypothetical protein
LGSEHAAESLRGGFILFDHEGDTPRRDAEVVHRHAAQDAVVVLHDLVSPDVAAALAHLREQGWDTYLYRTMQIMGMAVRGGATPVDHVPAELEHRMAAMLQELEAQAAAAAAPPDLGTLAPLAPYPQQDTRDSECSAKHKHPEPFPHRPMTRTFRESRQQLRPGER